MKKNPFLKKGYKDPFCLIHYTACLLYSYEIYSFHKYMHELWKQTNWYAYNTSTMSVGIYSKDTLCLLSSLNLLYDLHLLFLKLSFKGRQSGRRILGYFMKLQLIANLSSALAWWHWLVRRPCKHLIAIHIRYGTQINSLSTWHAFANPLKCYILVSYQMWFC